MAFDGILTHNLANELHEILQGARLDKIQQPSRYEMLLTFSNRGMNKLYISTNPSSPYCHLTDLKFTNPDVAPRFTMFLRKHLQGARVNKIYCPKFERIIVINFTFIDEFSEVINLNLIVELLTGAANIILVGDDNIIRDALFFNQVSDKRVISPKFEYTAPEAQNKPLPEDRLIEINENLELLKTTSDLSSLYLDKIDSHKSLDKELIKLSLGVSPQVVNEIIFRSQISNNASILSLTYQEAINLLEAAKSVLEEALYNNSAYIYTDSRLKKPEYHCIKLQSLGYAQELDSISATINYIHQLKANDQALDKQRQQLSSIVKKELKKSEKLLNNYYKDIKSNENFEDNRLIADLLLAQLHNLPDSMPSNAKIILENYYDPELKEIEVALNPKLHMKQQAPYFYKKYNKSKDTYTYAQNHIPETEDLINYLNTLLSQLNNAEDIETLDALKIEIINGPLKHKVNTSDTGNKKAKINKSKAKKVKHPQALPPQEFISSNGFTILAGRNNLQNDKLTFSNPDKNHLWFHAKNKPGTHVVLQGSISEVKDIDIIEAAEIAAWLSLSAQEKKIANIISIDIDFCSLKNVKKPNGAKPGFVIYDNYKTIRAEAKYHQELKK